MKNEYKLRIISGSIIFSIFICAIFYSIESFSVLLILLGFLMITECFNITSQIRNRVFILFASALIIFSSVISLIEVRKIEKMEVKLFCGIF